MDIAKVIKTGNSLGLHIPKKYLQALKLKAGDHMLIQLAGKTIFLDKLTLPKNEAKILSHGSETKD